MSRSSNTSGIGQRPATPSAIVSIAVGLDHCSLTPRQCHRRRTDRLDSDHLDPFGERPDGEAHAAGHRAPTDRHEHDVELRIVSHELEADGGGTLAGRQIQAVLNQIGATRLGKFPHPDPSVFDVLALEPQIRAERGDLAQLGWVCCSRRDNGDLQASMPAAVGQRLPEIAGARAHHA